MNSSNETRFKDEKSTGYVFISYSSKNQQMADSVRLMLKENRIPCWMAPYDIPAGHRYAYVINEALENCSCLLLLLTNASQNSQFVEREVERAITYRKPILPMQLEDLELNSGFKFYIGNSQIVENNHIVDDRYDCDTSTWSNIIAIAVGGHNIYGLKADGTLKAVGINYYGECEVSNLKLFSDAQSFVQSLNEQKTMLENMRGKSNSD